MFVAASFGAFSRVLDALAQQVDAVDDNDLAKPSPCTGWSVHDVLFHVLIALDLFEQLARNGAWRSSDVEYPTLSNSSDARSEYASRAARSRDAWSAPAALTRDCEMPFGPMSGAQALAIHAADLLIHAWDIGTGRGAPPMFDDDLAQLALEIEQALITPSMRGDQAAFGPEIPVPPGASPTAQLLGFVGRTPETNHAPGSNSAGDSPGER